MAAKAAHLLEVSKAKMAKVLRWDKIPYIPDPCNERTKLINWSDIDTWLARVLHPRVPISDGSTYKQPTCSNVHKPIGNIAAEARVAKRT